MLTWKKTVKGAAVMVPTCACDGCTRRARWEPVLLGHGTTELVCTTCKADMVKAWNSARGGA